MSVALIVLRLEIQDDCDVVPQLHYQANEYFQFTSEQEQTPLPTTDLSITLKSEVEDPPNLFKKDPGLHWGSRPFAQYSIQTYYPTVMESEEVKGEESSHEEEVEESSRLSESSETVVKTPNTIQFFSGNPSVEITWGIMHLYKDRFQVPFDSTTPRSELLCILGVPSKCSCQELQDYIAPARDTIRHIKIIRDSIPNNQYMVLIRFKDQISADIFYHEYEGKPFNLLENEVSHIVYVSRVESIKSSRGGYLPVTDLTELPTCPVCLERMDESVDGILTVLCNHSFHNDCLIKWEDTNCPVCRYCQTPEPTAEQTCSECDSKESLWICVICGHIGCGRYQEQHAYQHYQQTAHTFSMHLVNQRVWDYAGDNYVHRLIQEKGESVPKVVAYDNSEDVEDEKMDSLTLEYTYLLTNQLESQRLYFEEKIEFLESDAYEKISLMESDVHRATQDCRMLDTKLSECEKERKQTEKKYEGVVSKVANLAKELRDEKQLNQCLRDNQSMWKEQVAQLEMKFQLLEEERRAEVGELQGQVTDLMRHLEVQSAVGNAECGIKEDIQGGQVFVEQTSSPSNGGARSKNKKKK